jgi:hypothetical protein
MEASRSPFRELVNKIEAVVSDTDALVALDTAIREHPGDDGLTDRERTMLLDRIGQYQLDNQRFANPDQIAFDRERQ